MHTRQQPLDKGQKSGRVRPQPGAAVEFPNEPRISRKTPRRGIADLDVVARQSQNGDGFPRRRAGTLGEEHPERLCGINHAQSLLHPLPLSLIFGWRFACLGFSLVSDFNDAFPLSGTRRRGSHAAVFMDK
jgi:hypothetical protein